MTKLLLMFIDLFHDTVAVSDYIACDGKLVVKNDGCLTVYLPHEII